MSIQSCQRNVVEILKISKQKNRNKDNGPEKIISDLGDENCPSGREGLADDGGLRKGRSQSFSFGSFQKKKEEKKEIIVGGKKTIALNRGVGGRCLVFADRVKLSDIPDLGVLKFRLFLRDFQRVRSCCCYGHHSTTLESLLSCIVGRNFSHQFVYNFLEIGLNISSQDV